MMIPDLEARASEVSVAEWQAEAAAFAATVEFRVVKVTRPTAQFSRRAYDRNDWEPTTERAEWTVQAFAGDVNLTAEARRVLADHDATTEYPWLAVLAADYATTARHRTKKAAQADVEWATRTFTETLTDKWNYWNAVDQKGMQ